MMHIPSLQGRQLLVGHSPATTAAEAAVAGNLYLALAPSHSSKAHLLSARVWQNLGFWLRHGPELLTLGSKAAPNFACPVFFTSGSGRRTPIMMGDCNLKKGRVILKRLLETFSVLTEMFKNCFKNWLKIYIHDFYGGEITVRTWHYLSTHGICRIGKASMAS